MRGPIGCLFTLIGKAKKGLHVLRCPVFTENIGEERKKRSSLFVIRSLIFSEAPHFLRGPIGFSMLSLYVNPALHVVEFKNSY